MKSDIKMYQTAEGLTDEQMATLLSDRLGRPVSVQGYKIVRGRGDAPEDWLRVLGITPQMSDEPTSPGDAATRPRLSPDEGGVTGGGDVARLPLPFDAKSTEMQIALVYQMAGKGAAMAMRCPPVEQVWSNYAPEIAAAYIAWARENAAVARWISMLTLGGPAGNLVTLHASLIVSSLIVSNQFNAANLIPPDMRTAQETDGLQDDGSPVIDLDELRDDIASEQKPQRPRSRTKR